MILGKGLCAKFIGEVKDWRSYKVDETVPELLDYQRRLKSLGLHDPWIRLLLHRGRNEVWKFREKPFEYKSFWLFRWKWGAAIAVTCALYHFTLGDGSHPSPPRLMGREIDFEKLNPHHH